MLDLVTASQVLKDDYQSLKDALNNSVFILAQIEKNTKDVVGEKAVHTVHLRRSSGVGSRPYNSVIPTPGKQGYKKVNVVQRYHYGSIRVSRSVMKAMKSDRGSFVRAVESEMKGIEKDVKRDQNRQVWGTGDGVIAVCGTTSNDTTVVLAASTTRVQMRHLWNDGGMVVDIGTVASPTAVATAREVTDVDFDARTFEISGDAITTSSSHRVFRTGSGGASDGSGDIDDGQAELTGLQLIVDDTASLHGIDPATQPKWRSKVYANGGINRHPAEILVNRAIQDTQVESGGFVDLLLTSIGVSNTIAADMQAMRRNVDKVSLKAGYSGIAWNVLGVDGANMSDRALVPEQDCPENELYGLTSADLVKYVMADWEWVDEDGSVFSRAKDGTDAFDAYYAAYYDVAAYLRNGHFVIRDLSEA